VDGPHCGIIAAVYGDAESEIALAGVRRLVAGVLIALGARGLGTDWPNKPMVPTAPASLATNPLRSLRRHIGQPLGRTFGGVPDDRLV